MNTNTYDFNSKEYLTLLKDYKNHQKEQKLIVLAGEFSENRKFALNQFISDSIGEPVIVNLSDYVTPYEDETYAKLDTLFDELSKTEHLTVFKEAEQLSGVYTGHTNSKVKYATPQEKYFINKLNTLKGSAILEFENIDHLDNTIIRKADAVVTFKVPNSLLEKLFFKITQVRLHGSRFSTQRPA